MKNTELFWKSFLIWIFINNTRLNIRSSNLCRLVLNSVIPQNQISKHSKMQRGKSRSPSRATLSNRGVHATELCVLHWGSGPTAGLGYWLSRQLAGSSSIHLFAWSELSLLQAKDKEKLETEKTGVWLKTLPLIVTLLSFYRRNQKSRKCLSVNTF